MDSKYWQGKRVVVTGGLGFIGSHFVEELLAAGAEVISLHRRPLGDTDWMPLSEHLRMVQVDLLDDAEVHALMKYVAPRIDAIVHCAALDGNTKFKLDHAAQILDANLRMTSSILNAARANNVGEVVLMSSAEIYAPAAISPIAEEDDYKQQLGYTENGYVLSKTFSEVMAELHRKEFAMNIFLPRLTNVYGPRDLFSSEKPTRVIPAMMHRISNGEAVDIWGDGSQERSFMYVTDVVHSVLQMVERKTHHVMNIATREQVSVLNLAKLIAESFGESERINLDLSKPTGVQRREMSVDKLYSTIDFEPRTVADGLTDTASWLNGYNGKRTVRS